MRTTDRRCAQPATLGFTLIEMLVTLAIMSVISSVTIVNVNEARTRAKYVKAQSDLYDLSIATANLELDTGMSVGKNVLGKCEESDNQNAVTKPAGPNYADGVEFPLSGEFNGVDYTEFSGITRNDGEYSGWQGPYTTNLTDPWGRPYWFDPDYQCKGAEGTPIAKGCENASIPGAAYRVLYSRGPVTNESAANDYGADNIVRILCEVGEEMMFVSDSSSGGSGGGGSGGGGGSTWTSGNDFAAVAGSPYPDIPFSGGASPSSFAADAPTTAIGGYTFNSGNINIPSTTYVQGTLSVSSNVSLSANYGYTPTLNPEATAVSVGTTYKDSVLTEGSAPVASWCPRSGAYKYCTITALSLQGQSPSINLSAGESRTVYISYTHKQLINGSGGNQCNNCASVPAGKSGSPYPYIINYTSPQQSYTVPNCSEIISASGSSFVYVPYSGNGTGYSFGPVTNNGTGCTVYYKVHVDGTGSGYVSTVTLSLNYKQPIVPKSGTSNGSASSGGYTPLNSSSIKSYVLSCSPPYTSCAVQNIQLNNNGTVSYIVAWSTNSLTPGSINSVSGTLQRSGTQPYNSPPVQRQMTVPEGYENGTVDFCIIEWSLDQPKRPLGEATISNATITGTTLSYMLQQYNPDLTPQRIAAVDCKLSRTTYTSTAD